MNGPLEILVASRCLGWPLHYGDRLILHHVVSQLRARAHNCDVVALRQSGDSQEAVARTSALCRELDVVTERPRSLAQYVRRLARPFPRRPADCWHPELWRSLERRLSARRYDVVHLFGGIHVYELQALVSRWPNVIVPYESHSRFLERELMTAGAPMARIRSFAALGAARAYERRIYRGFDRVVVLTDADRDSLVRLAPGLPAVVIPNGVCRFDVDRKSGLPPLLLFVGNFEYPPNIEAATTLVRDVLPAVQRRQPDVRVALVGANPPPAVEAMSSDRVEVTGWVADLRPHLSRASCLVAPLRRGAGMKNKILEAMAAGVPVVTTPCGSEGIDARDGEHILIGSSSRELAELTMRVIDDPSWGGAIGRRGQCLVERRYSWQAVAQRYEALYRDVIAARTVGSPPD